MRQNAYVPSLPAGNLEELLLSALADKTLLHQLLRALALGASHCNTEKHILAPFQRS